MQTPVKENELQTFRAIVQQHTGFNFPSGLEQEFRFRVERALRQSGEQLSEVLQQVYTAATSQQVLQVLLPLLPELLIGETYFWREPESYATLQQYILPELVQRKAPYSRLLRVWSAACSTGEEAYSLAILLKNHFKNSEWSFSIMGSDLNGESLKKARPAEYGRYSLRGNENRLAGYFDVSQDGTRFRLKEIYRENVRFQQINLAADYYPSPANDTCNYDLIFCRNIFIYFKPELVEQVIERLYQALNEGGYLLVSPCECSSHHFKQFETVQFGSVTFYRRPAHVAPALSTMPVSNLPAVAVSLPPPVLPVAPETDWLSEARAALKQGNSAQAIDMGHKAIKANSLQAESYLLLTALYQESGKPEVALEMARKFNYLEPDRVEGLFYLATLQHSLGKPRRAGHLYRRLLTRLTELDPASQFDWLPGLPAAELREIVSQGLLTLEAVG